jgi:hypothetical protein
MVCRNFPPYQVIYLSASTEIYSCLRGRTKCLRGLFICLRDVCACMVATYYLSVDSSYVVSGELIPASSRIVIPVACVSTNSGIHLRVFRMDPPVKPWGDGRRWTPRSSRGVTDGERGERHSRGGGNPSEIRIRMDPPAKPWGDGWSVIPVQARSAQTAVSIWGFSGWTPRSSRGVTDEDGPPGQAVG